MNDISDFLALKDHLKANLKSFFCGHLSPATKTNLNSVSEGLMEYPRSIYCKS